MSEPFLDRDAAAAYVRAKGLPCTKLTLQKLASVGGGPEFHKFGAKHVRYRPSGLDRWIETKLSGPLSSTSQAA